MRAIVCNDCKTQQTINNPFTTPTNWATFEIISRGSRSPGSRKEITFCPSCCEKRGIQVNYPQPTNLPENIFDELQDAIRDLVVDVINEGR